MFDIETVFILATTFGAIGNLLIAVVVVNVHQHIMRERKIDLDVIRTMRRERAYVIVGIALIVVSYFLEVYALAGL